MGERLLKFIQTFGTDLFGCSVPTFYPYFTSSSTILVFTTITSRNHPVHSEALWCGRKLPAFVFRLQQDKYNLGRALSVVDTLLFCSPAMVTYRVCTVPALRDAWKPFRVVLEDLWFTLVAVAIHFIWTDRNRRLFAHGTSTPTAPAVSAIYSTLSVHIRYFQRQCYDTEQLEQLTQVLASYQHTGSARRYFSTRPSLL